MYSKVIINIILILGLVIFQLSFISGLPLGINNLNLILVILIFILSLFSLNLALWWVIGIGLMLDMLSFMPFGVYLACLSSTIIITSFLLNHFFTNRSLYSFFALVGITTIIYELFLNVSGYLILVISNQELSIIINTNFWLIKLYQLSLNLLATLIIFFILNFISNRFKPVFLMKHK